MPDPMAFLNGRLLPQTEACLPLHDAGFVFGATVTDLCRTFRHRLYRLADHLARFRTSCQLARVPLLASDAELVELAERLAVHNATLLKPEQDLALVMFATPGPVSHYAGTPAAGTRGADAPRSPPPPTLGMHTFPLPFVRYRRLFQEGAHLVIPPTRHVPASSVDPRIKHRSRLHWWLAEQGAQDLEPGASALLLDLEGHVTETAAANFLMVRGGTVLSPPRSTILGGISLLTVEELCGELGIRFKERPLTLADCQGADEAILSCTSYCLCGVSRLNGQAVPWPGPVFEQLLSAWSKRVGLDIRGQILADG